jgi:hypothetical protein
MEHFKERSEKVEKLLVKFRKVAAGESFGDAGLDLSLIEAYGRIARRVRDDRELGLLRYPYEAAAGVSPYAGGFFAHPEWSVRRGLTRHPGLRAIAEYEANYVNAAGYWLVFAETAIRLRDEELAREGGAGESAAGLLDTWIALAIRYGLRVVGLRTEFFRLSAKDPAHARLLMPALENQGTVAATDDIAETMAKLDTHFATQLMKAAASLSADNAIRKAGDGGASQ